MKKFLFITVFVGAFLAGCHQPQPKYTNIEEVILNDPGSFFYINFKTYPRHDAKLPVGIFDSGTGGLTVLDAILRSDHFNNSTHKKGKDGKIDFSSESFIYLGDKANMPYGEYPGNHKTKLLQEHVMKDMQFMLGNKYYPSQTAKNYRTDKPPVKAIVIACNTATAYGKKKIEQFLKRAGLPLKVIGVIGAGVRGALEDIPKDSNAVIGIMATAGTVASHGYPNTVEEQKKKWGYTGKITSFQQAGVGLAAAIDGEKDYLDPSLTSVRKNYRGPSFSNKIAPIDKSILQRYHFDFSGNHVLFTGTPDNPKEIQLNTVDNYIRYHVISLLEKIRKSGTSTRLSAIILGCTHYPFYMDNFRKVLHYAYNYKENGQYVYRRFMKKKVALIDPAVNTAKELYVYLNKQHLFNNGKLSDSRFFISVPNLDNPNIKLADSLNFTYAYKYGRKAGQIQQYVKRVPFSKRNLSPALLTRLKVKIPLTYSLIENSMKVQQ
ncbi:Asp/Glu/hydantoin racemase [Candidatus Sulfidibacterium hydrothermale]|uniref:glutamate racemase n=1 Tax=Candidatus Sulfidibacterium hydrothermale TaxID=2875962 RepID=UPI001F0A1CB5|nr:Asp/Glu/hydantoin racemase [Candidatus Sulfidibacterium hydrothermale]UBM62931.1 Asp/Glu/hydantoin racemase [Candidatus Sulfidibacterium hydrothermale]